MAQRFTACRGHIPDMHFGARSKYTENMTANITLKFMKMLYRWSTEVSQLKNKIAGC